MFQVIREFIYVYGARQFMAELIVLPLCLITLFVVVTLFAAI